MLVVVIAAFIERQTYTASGTVRGGELVFKEDVMEAMFRSVGFASVQFLAPL